VSTDMPEIPDISPQLEPENVPPYAFVAIVDGVVVRRFNVDAEAAAVFARNPTFVQIPAGAVIPRGSTYDGTTFTAPAVPE
jgi:hypothetical protein